MKPEISDIFMNIAKEISKRSTCAKIKVGCVITNQNRIISTGWNGTSSGKEECCDHFRDYKDSEEKFLEDHARYSVLNEIHAEVNAVLFADRDLLKGATLYCTLQPCIHCAKLIVQSGIKKVVFGETYDRESDGLNYLLKNLEVKRVEGEKNDKK